MLRVLTHGKIAKRLGREFTGLRQLVPPTVNARRGREQERHQGRVKVLANDQHRGRRQQGNVMVRDVLTQVDHSRGQGHRSQISESAMIGLVLVEVDQSHASIVQKPLNVISLECRDEERGIKLSFLQSRGRRGDVFLDQHGPRIFLGEIRIRPGRLQRATGVAIA